MLAALLSSLAAGGGSSLGGCGGLGVEQYREAQPNETLAVRFVVEAEGADEERAADEVLPRLGSREPVVLEAGALLRAEHIAHVQLLESGEGEQLLVLQLHDEGRARLREASAGAAGRRVAVVADGVVLATPTIQGVLDQSEIALRIPSSRIRAAFAAASAR